MKIYQTNKDNLVIDFQKEGVKNITISQIDFNDPEIKLGENDTTTWEQGEGDFSAQLIGTLSTATGNGSVAEGSHTHAGAECSHAEGFFTATSDINQANYSHVEGLNNGTNNVAEHGEGKYGVSYYGKNAPDSERSIHYVGIGTSDYIDYRKNAEVIMTNGDKYIYGIGGYDGKDITNAKTIQEVISEILTRLDNLNN